MKITMNDSRLINVTQLQEFLKGSQGVNLSLTDAPIEEKYKFINETIKRLNYPELSKKEKRIVYVYLRKITGYKKAQLYRLMQKAETGKLKKNIYQRVNPHKIYTSYDIKLLEKTDELHLRMSEKAENPSRTCHFNNIYHLSDGIGEFILSLLPFFCNTFFYPLA